MRYCLLLTALAASFLLFSCAKFPGGGGRTDLGPSASPVKVSSDDVIASEPAIVRDSVGLTYVVYVEHKDKDADVFLQKLDQGGRVIGKKVRVNPKVGEAKAWKGDPPTIAVAQDNTVYVGWTRKLTGQDKGNDLLLSASRDGGNTFSAPSKVNDDEKPASHGMHSLAIDSSGKIYVAWLDERNIVEKQRHDMSKMDAAGQHHDETEPNSEVFYSISRDAGRTFAVNKRIATEVCPCCKTSLLAAPDGTVYAGWRQVLNGDHRHIAVAHSNDGGATFSAGVVVSDDNWQLSACPVSGAALASASPNTLDVVWYTAGAAGQAGVYFTRSTDGGSTFAQRMLVSSEGASGTPAVFYQGGYTFSVFATTDGGSMTARWSGLPSDSLKVEKTAAATVPTAANGVYAFVREVGGKNSVWVAMPGKS